MTLTLFDEFCGFGGSSQGAATIPGVELVLAANHNPLAIDVLYVAYWHRSLGRDPDWIDWNQPAAHAIDGMHQAGPRRWPYIPPPQQLALDLAAVRAASARTEAPP